MLKAVIIDDEQRCVTSLQKDIEKYCPEVTVDAAFTSPKEAIVYINKSEPDLVFLDIEMPLINGFEMLELIKEITFEIIFTTAYDQFAARAFRISAIDYLLKPIDPKDLKEALLKVSAKYGNNNRKNKIENLLHNIRLPDIQQKIALPERAGYEFVEVSNIMFCHAEGTYTTIVLEAGKKLLISKTLGDIEEILPAEIFQRIHHSTLVNLQHVTHFIRTDGGYVQLKNGEKLTVSKAKKEALMQRLGLK